MDLSSALTLFLDVQKNLLQPAASSVCLCPYRSSVKRRVRPQLQTYRNTVVDANLHQIILQYDLVIHNYGFY